MKIILVIILIIQLLSLLVALSTNNYLEGINLQLNNWEVVDED